MAVIYLFNIYLHFNSNKYKKKKKNKTISTKHQTESSLHTSSVFTAAKLTLDLFNTDFVYKSLCGMFWENIWLFLKKNTFCCRGQGDPIQSNFSIYLSNVMN